MLNYRPDIDGLRAVAVLGVLIYHAGLGCQGGFVGVDVFFVISGFLITSLILRDLRQGAFSFVDFWARRIRRIVPALAVMILAVIVVGYFGMFPVPYEILGKHVIAVLLCVSNIKFWKEDGYFATNSDEKSLLHTWSLSVEEQFYFVIPIALFLIFKFKREKIAFLLIILICTISLAASIYASAQAPVANFYLLPTRAWELGVGSILAFVGPIRNAKLREVFSFLGLSLIIGGYFLFPDGVSFPGVSAIPPVLGAALVIWSGIGAARLPTINRFLTLKPILGVGLISYSLYLWHWPIFAYQKHLGYSVSSSYIQIGLSLFSFLPAFLSWKFIEIPFRKKLFCKTQRGVINFGGLTAATFLFLGGVLWYSGGNVGRFDKEAMSYDLCSERLKNSEYLSNEAKIDFVLWGDSHAGALSSTFGKKSRSLGINGKAFSKGGCPPLLNVERYDRTISSYNNETIDKIIKLSPRVVFLLGRWHILVSGKPQFDGGHSNDLGSLIKHSSISDFSKDNASKSLKISLRETAHSLNKHGIKVFVIKGLPQLNTDALHRFWESNYPTLPLRRYSFSNACITKNEHQVLQSRVSFIIDEVCRELPLTTSLSIEDEFFPNGLAFKPYNKEGSFYTDNNHLSVFGADLLLGEKVTKWLQGAVTE